MNTGREKYKRAALLLTEFLNDILEDRQNVLTDIGSADNLLRIYLDKVRDTPLEELDSEEKRKLVFLLLR